LPGKLFEDLGIRYFGPVDGHNLSHLIDILRKVKNIKNGPKIVHVFTKKGKGYEFAEKNPGKYHGVAPFNPGTGEFVEKKKKSLSHVAGKVLCDLAENDSTVCAITAAMTSGTGLDLFAKKYPHNFFDVGIAEQHAVTFAAALAKNKLRPYFAVYSTFLQRGYDQIIHDVATMNFPVTFLIDRSGVVGEDGETHHGLFDVSYLNPIPGLKIFAPSTAEELYETIYYTHHNEKGPVAIKYPRKSIEGSLPEKSPYELDPKKVIVDKQASVMLLVYGSCFDLALESAKLLNEKNRETGIIKLNQIKPLPVDELEPVLSFCSHFFIIEDQIKRGGISDSLLASIKPEHRSKNRYNFSFPEEFICHGSPDEIFELYGLTPETISDKILECVNGTA
jgi:1-deoxy-D-xylulose-5-phosphate synthase